MNGSAGTSWSDCRFSRPLEFAFFWLRLSQFNEQRIGFRGLWRCHTFRHSFATHQLEGGHDIQTVQELPGRSDVKTTMIYIHVSNGDRLAFAIASMDYAVNAKVFVIIVDAIGGIP